MDQFHASTLTTTTFDCANYEMVQYDNSMLVITAADHTSDEMDFHHNCKCQHYKTVLADRNARTSHYYKDRDYNFVLDGYSGTLLRQLSRGLNIRMTDNF